MYTGTLKTNSYSEMNKPEINSIHSLKLLRLFEKMKLKRTWMKGELNSKILVNTSEKQIVLTTIHEDTEIDSFQSNDSVTFQVIGGKLKLHTRKESIILSEGQFLVLHEHVKYRLTATAETVFLMTIANRGSHTELNELT